MHVNACDGKGAPTLGLDGDRIREDVHVRTCDVDIHVHACQGCKLTPAHRPVAGKFAVGQVKFTIGQLIDSNTIFAQV